MSSFFDIGSGGRSNAFVSAWIRVIVLADTYASLGTDWRVDYMVIHNRANTILGYRILLANASDTIRSITSASGNPAAAIILG